MIQDVSDLPDPRRNEIDPTRVPYSDDALRANLLRLENAWEEFQSTRDRAAVYLYLAPVFELVAVWEAKGQLREITCRALRLRLRRYEVSAGSHCCGDFLHVGSGKGRPEDPQQMVKGFAIRWRIQASSRAATGFYPAQGRHQRMHGTLCPAPRTTQRKTHKTATRPHLGRRHYAAVIIISQQIPRRSIASCAASGRNQSE